MGAFDDAISGAKKTVDQFYDPATSFASGIWPGMKGLFGEQKADTNSFLTNMRTQIGNQENYAHVGERLGRELGVPEMKQSYLNLSNTLSNIPNTYSSATKGYDVNQNQLDRTVATKTAQLQPTVQALGTALGSANDYIQAGQSAAMEQDKKELIPNEYEATFLGDRFARETTGYTTSVGAELDALLKKAASGVGLTDSELTRGNELAMKKLDYDAKMAEIKSNEAIARQKNLISLASSFNS